MSDPCRKGGPIFCSSPWTKSNGSSMTWPEKMAHCETVISQKLTPQLL